MPPQLDTIHAPFLNSVNGTAEMDGYAQVLADPAQVYTGPWDPLPDPKVDAPAEIALPPRPGVDGPPIPSGTVMEFKFPKVKSGTLEYYLDFCLDWGAGCGRDAALNYCRCVTWVLVTRSGREEAGGAGVCAMQRAGGTGVAGVAWHGVSGIGSLQLAWRWHGERRARGVTCCRLLPAGAVAAAGSCMRASM